MLQLSTILMRLFGCPYNNDLKLFKNKLKWFKEKSLKSEDPNI